MSKEEVKKNDDTQKFNAEIQQSLPPSVHNVFSNMKTCKCELYESMIGLYLPDEELCFSWFDVLDPCPPLPTKRFKGKGREEEKQTHLWGLHMWMGERERENCGSCFQRNVTMVCQSYLSFCSHYVILWCALSNQWTRRHPNPPPDPLNIQLGFLNVWCLTHRKKEKI